MGLSAMQARLLMIVSRMNDIAAEQEKISQAQNDLALESEIISREYAEKMANTKVVINVQNNNNDSFTTTTKDLDYNSMVENGYLAVTKNDEILLKKDNNGEWIIPKDIDGNDLITISNGKAIIKGDSSSKEYKIKNGTQYLTDSTSLNTALSYGALFLIDTANLDTGKISTSNIASSQNLQVVQDTSDDAAAQSKYQYETARIARIDNQYDLAAKKLETEQTALSKEYDSITKAIETNVNRTFNLFENG